MMACHMQWCPLYTEAEFMNVQFRWGFWAKTLKFSDFEVSVYNIYITNQFQITFAQGGGGGSKTPVSRGNCE